MTWRNLLENINHFNYFFLKLLFLIHLEIPPYGKWMLNFQLAFQLHCRVWVDLLIFNYFLHLLLPSRSNHVRWWEWTSNREWTATEWGCPCECDLSRSCSRSSKGGLLLRACWGWAAFGCSSFARIWFWGNSVSASFEFSSFGYWCFP